jgi:sarcosine oxidase subunit beta
VARTEIVVIGGGVVGLAASIELAGRGARVVLVERGLPGAANSVLTGGGIRQQFGTETNVRLAQLSAPVWESFEARFGVDPLFQRIGYLFLARTTDQAARLASHVALQASLGVDSQYLDATEIAARWPALCDRAFVGAGFRAADGWANQHRIVEGLVRGALAAGVELRVGTEALAIETVGGRVSGVRTTDGRITADALVVATGAWVRKLLGPLGVDLPIVGRRHELAVVEPRDALPAGLPWLIGVEDDVHLRPDTPGRVLVGGFLGRDEEVDPDRYETRADDGWTSAILATAERVFGIMRRDATVRHSWAGLYPGTPDRHPIVDRIGDGLFVALGFAGTGLMMSPAAGLLVAELIIDGGLRSIDPDPLRADRFEQTDDAPETTGF